MTSTIRMPVAAPALTEEGPAFPWELLQSARALDLNEDHLVLAWELARLPHALTAQEQRAVMLLTLASLAAVSQGSTRVGVAGPHAAVLSALLERLGASAADVERVQALLHEARTSGERGRLAPIVGGRGGYRPFVVDGEHLYHHRMLALEERLGALLSARLQQMPRTSEADFAGGLEDLQRRPAWAAGREVALSVEQRAAVAAAAAHALTVITGGPGTGKTAIVVAVLRLLAREGRVPLEAVALAAPTGKATDRMRQLVEASLHSVRERGAADEALLKTLPAARTLHRLLGYSPSSGRFRHHEGNPLAERFVIVDEGSMVDLALMDRLLRALRPDAQLVILGDAEQLPSVEAGAAFRDLCACIGERRRVLTWSYRMDASDPCGRAVLHVAGLVNRGEVAGLFPTAAQRPTVD